MDYPSGSDPFTSRQHLLHHTFSPLISIEATHNVDLIFQSIINNNDNVSTLQIFKPYGDNAKYSISTSSQQFKIINNQLIAKNYPSFPIRFEPSLPDLISVLNAQQRNPKSSNNQNLNNSNGLLLNKLNSNSSPSLSNSISEEFKTRSEGVPLNQLFSISSLEVYLRHLSNPDNNSKSTTENGSLYLNFFDKLITSNQITPFETFNHPISQIFIIDYETDSIETLRKLIVEFRNYNFPKFFQIDDLLIHVFIIYDCDKFANGDIINFQNEIKNKLNVNTTVFPMSYNNSATENPPGVETNTISLVENSTIDEELQRISLNDINNSFEIPKIVDSTIRSKLYEFINKFLIPHMQSKVRYWDDQILQPKKSITGRFFQVSKKFFNSNNNSDTNLLTNTAKSFKNGVNHINSNSNSNSTFNYNENYYYKSSSEQILRKLADWSLMLKDFKYAYSTYELIKKDYSNDRAWVYVASTQEMCIVSLLLVQTQQQPQQQNIKSSIPDKNTLRKIKHDIIEPYMDNLCYTFKSRLNLKTFSFKTMIIVIELLLCMSQMFNISYWWYDTIEKYLIKLNNEFDQHLSSANNDSTFSIIKALLYERLGYNSGHSVFLSLENYHLFRKNFEQNKLQQQPQEEEEEGVYVNNLKLSTPTNRGIVGTTRFRKSALWYLLSMKQWHLSNNKFQIERLFNNIQLVYPDTNFNSNEKVDIWYNRSDGILGILEKYRDTDK
ncbi:transport protein particle, subunit [Candida dubliniensis CD36]|uniref:Transport protein particle, subunit n=1 Tax=Candida dubliniensis (strain CD36 / ATCC MYA-646 / CBS 7987 / NCPF 3949 / NRRL Y-17841) TaxID=573826 RepID=B9W9P0_CANDC|nr:transport protein particle, subunit [Candida dubliniensis CD36]CAX45525.1 transport protein particle, subunit [Candida dubliniensis CD36]